MPNWVWKIITLIIAICFILTLGFVGYTILTVKSDNESTTNPPQPAPTVNSTAIAQYTPTPGPSSAQMATAVVLAKPTPYVAWSPADGKILIAGLRDKAIVSEQDINIASQLSSPGEAHICVDLNTVFDIKVDEYCKISLTWTEWALAYKPQDIQVKVENGAVETDTSKMELSADGTHYEQKPYAKVTIIIDSVGIVGPTTRFDQSYDFYQDIGGVWNLAIDLKKIFLGDDLRNQINEATQDTGDLALADSFAPLEDNGFRSSEYSDQLYAAFVASLTTPGQGHIYNRLLDYATLVANDRTANKDAGFAGLESLTVIVPAKPASPCDYVYAEDMESLVLPRQYCVFTYQIIGVTPGMKQAIQNGIKQNVPGVEYDELIKRIQEIK